MIGGAGDEILQLAPVKPASHTHDPSRPRHRPLLLQWISAWHPPPHSLPYMSASHTLHSGPEKPSSHPDPGGVGVGVGDVVEILQLAPVKPA